MAGKPTTGTATKKRAAAAAAPPASKKPREQQQQQKQQQQQQQQQQGKVTARVDRAQALRAAQALLQHHAKVQADKAQAGKQKPSLLADEGEDGEDFIFVQVALARISERVSPKPVPIKLPLPLYRAGKDDHAVCVIVKEEDKGKVKRALAALRLDGVSEVVGLQELRTDYKEFQERRKLRDAFDLFLVDDRILPLLGKALGKIFFSKKKQPAPLKLAPILKGGDATVVGKRILAARERTYLYRNHGNCVSVRVARTTMGAEQVVTNLLAGLEQAVEALPGKWKNVMAVSVKTSRSVALPIYQRLPQYLINKPKAALPADPLMLAELDKREKGEQGKGGKGKGEKEQGSKKKGEEKGAKTAVVKGGGERKEGGKKRPREAPAAANAVGKKAAAGTGEKKKSKVVKGGGKVVGKA